MYQERANVTLDIESTIDGTSAFVPVADSLSPYHRRDEVY
jgi:hypothetical protein